LVSRWSKEQYDFERWKYLEFARFFTNNTIPSLGYFLLNHLISRKKIRSIITTNYDLYLNSVFERTSNSTRSHCFNPVKNNNDFDWENYYTSRKSLNFDTVKIFKIHGSLTHVVFKNCSPQNNQLHIFKLPSFLVGFDTRQIRRKFRLKYLHNYLGHIGVKHNQPTLINDSSRTGYYVHYIDWAVKPLCNSRTNYRDFFKKEIEYAIKELKKIKNIGAIIIIGFTGYHNEANLRDDRNEELTPIIVSLLGKVPVFHFLEEEQYRKASGNINKLHLWNAVKNVNVSHVNTYTNTGDFLMSLICGKNKLLRNRLKAEHDADWVNGNLFMNPSNL
jgi:hypothetical protein